MKILSGHFTSFLGHYDNIQLHVTQITSVNFTLDCMHFPVFIGKRWITYKKQTGSEISDFLAGFLNTESVSKLITVIAINKRINS